MKKSRPVAVETFNNGVEMARLIVGAALFAMGFMLAPAAFAQGKQDVTDMQALQKAVQTDKRAFVATTLKLTDAEGKKFWPLYEVYQRDLNMANRRRVVVVERLIALDKPLSDLYAKSLASELLASDDAEIKARKALQSRLMRALPPRKAARYLQLESKIRALNAYNIASTIPLIE